MYFSSIIILSKQNRTIPYYFAFFTIIKNSEPTSNYTKNFAHVSRQSW